MIRGYQVGINRQAQNPEPFWEIKLPERFVPVGWSTFELLCAPDVIHEDVDVANRISNLVRQALDLHGVEMVDSGGNALAAQRGGQRGHRLRHRGHDGQYLGGYDLFTIGAILQVQIGEPIRTRYEIT